jgi:hypothetical protein
MRHRFEATELWLIATSIIRDFRIVRWLALECQRMLMRDGDPFVQLAGAGLLTRLMVVNPEKRCRLIVMERLISGDTPANRLRDWWRSECETLWPIIETTSMSLISEMTIELNDLSKMKGELMKRTAERWLTKRDDLESITHIAHEEAKRLIIPLLKELDRLALEHRSLFNTVEGNERLWAVGYSAPDIWWGEIPYENFDRKEARAK